MEYGDERYRDCMRDVLAMVEQCIAIHGGGPARDLAAENLELLLEAADSASCLKLAVSMLASSCEVVSDIRAGALGTTRDLELSAFFAEIRGRLD